MVVEVRAVITKYHRLGGLHNKHLLLTVLGFGKSKVKVPTDSRSDEAPLPGSRRAAFTMCPHRIQREIIGLLSLYKNTNPIMGAWSSGLNPTS